MSTILQYTLLLLYIYLAIGVLYWNIGLSFRPSEKGRWFPNPRNMHLIVTWGYQLWRKRR